MAEKGDETKVENLELKKLNVGIIILIIGFLIMFLGEYVFFSDYLEIDEAIDSNAAIEKKREIELIVITVILIGVIIALIGVFIIMYYFIIKAKNILRKKV
jgi:hypothetical protein